MKGRLTIWLISVIGIGEIVLSEPCGRDEALGVGETPGEPGVTFTMLSLEVRFGDNLAGKLRVFVHCDKLRTILTVHKHYTFTELDRERYVRSSRRSADECDAIRTYRPVAVQVATCTRRACVRTA